MFTIEKIADGCFRPFCNRCLQTTAEVGYMIKFDTINLYRLCDRCFNSTFSNQIENFPVRLHQNFLVLGGVATKRRVAKCINCKYFEYMYTVYGIINDTYMRRHYCKNCLKHDYTKIFEIIGPGLCVRSLFVAFAERDFYYPISALNIEEQQVVKKENKYIADTLDAFLPLELCEIVIDYYWLNQCI